MRALYERRKVSVLDGAAFGQQTAHFVRVCFATEEATIDAACERIRLFCMQDLPEDFLETFAISLSTWDAKYHPLWNSRPVESPL